MSNVIDMATEKDLIPGNTVFYVYAIPSKNGEITTWFEETLITSAPFKTSICMFVKCQKKYDGRVYNAEFSLKDCNIIENTYNCHRCFLTKEAAEAYAERIKDPAQWTANEARILNKWIHQLQFEWC